MEKSSASASASWITDVVRRSYRYTLKGYSLAKGMGPGKFVPSNKFIVAGYEWTIYFYPDGVHHEDRSLFTSLAVVLTSVGVTEGVEAFLELFLVDQSGSGKHIYHYNHSPHNGSPYNIMKSGSLWGYKRFYMKSLLEKSDYLKDDCLVMDLTIGIVRNRVETPTILVPPPDMGDCLEGLLKSGMNSDITLEVGDETFRAHKLILAARSPVFKAQFYGLIGNPDMEKIVVKDVQPLVFKAMLKFIYSDVQPDIHELTGSAPMAIYASIMQHLFVAADRYGLERLKLLCEAKLCEVVSADTVASTMALAEQHQCAHLKSICLKFTAARENLGDVVQTEEFEHLGKTNPSLLLDLLATIAAVDDDTCPSSRKRNWSRDIGLNLSDGVGSSGRQRPKHF